MLTPRRRLRPFFPPLIFLHQGVLHLVDLAGSERLDRSGVGADAQRLRETQSINKSLSCLADVFSSLSAKSTHIPFRNSKLTYLMQVGGNWILAWLLQMYRCTSVLVPPLCMYARCRSIGTRVRTVTVLCFVCSRSFFLIS